MAFISPSGTFLCFNLIFSLVQSIGPLNEPTNPCVPSPCGPNSKCEVYGTSSSCACLPNYYGSPPNCRPECTISSDCPSNKACIRNRCVDPCPGSCGLNAICNVRNHIPVCNCYEGYTGNPFTNCYPNPPICNLNPFSHFYNLYIRIQFK